MTTFRYEAFVCECGVDAATIEMLDGHANGRLAGRCAEHKDTPRCRACLRILDHEKGCILEPVFTDA